MLRIYAAHLLQLVNAKLPDEKKISLKFSNGWYNRFKERYHLRKNRIMGESVSADIEAVVDLMQALLAEIS